MYPAQLRDDVLARFGVAIDHPVVAAVQKNHKVVRFRVLGLSARVFLFGTDQKARQSCARFVSSHRETIGTP